MMNNKAWEKLPLAEWQDTKDTLHLWTQIVGKIRTAQTPLINHWWNTTLYVSARGLTTSAIPYKNRLFEMEFDFIQHKLVIKTSDGAIKTIDLEPKSVAAFYKEVFATLHSLDIEIEIRAIPDEIPDAIPFAEDNEHKSYNAEYAARFWRVLIQVDRVFKEFRSRFIGKCSPVHFFWGSFDLAVTRFSGRRAPERKGADNITREGYSHEVISHGFWCGGNGMDAAFYSYTAPAPKDLKNEKILPAKAFHNDEMSEFFLLYEDVRKTKSPDKTLMKFLQTTYEAGANLAKWNRVELERRL